jgi:taurine dioxygenase
MTISFSPLTPTIGAVVEGFQIAAPMSAADQGALAAALVEHQVLFFRDQHVTPQQHRAFAAGFGTLHVHPIYPKHEAVPEIIVLDTDLVDVADNSIWHTDVTFSQTPPLGAVLVARQLPAVGGDTLWANTIAAHDALSAPYRSFLRGLTATHDIVQSFPASRFGMTPEARRRLEEATARNPPVVHPVIRTHPVSKRQGVFVQKGFTTHINELSATESEAVLQQVYAHCTRPEFTVRWKWRLGDVAFWDNRSTQHYAVDDYRPARRVMHRATIIGDRPV